MKLNLLFSRLVFFVLIFFVVITGCKKDQPDHINSDPVSSFEHKVSYDWNETFLDIERYSQGFRPGPAPRALGYMGLATYEAIVSGMPDYKSIAIVFPGLQIPQADPNQVYHWPLVVNAVYGYMMPRIFLDATQQHKDKISNQERALELHYDNVSGDIRQRSIDHGRAVAKTVFDWASTDLYGHNSHRDPFRNYVPPQGPGRWVPTFPGPGNGMFPFWGKARTFAINEADKLCPPPIPYSTSPVSPYYTQALETYAMTTPLSYTNQWIAEFWSDDLVDLTFSPGPRWSAIANQVLQKEKSSLETAVLVHAKVGMALNDAAVACWHSKYVYNVERPVSYIKEYIDPNWREPLVNPLTGDQGISPSFPAYPSGHSTMGAAGAEILTSIFGSHYVLTDRCHEFRSEFIGTPRTFHNFYEMAEENGFSRIVLGVHFRMDCEQGVNLGYRVARKVNGLPWRR